MHFHTSLNERRKREDILSESIKTSVEFALTATPCPNLYFGDMLVMLIMSSNIYRHKLWFKMLTK